MILQWSPVLPNSSLKNREGLCRVCTIVLRPPPPSGAKTGVGGGLKMRYVQCSIFVRLEEALIRYGSMTFPWVMNYLTN